MGYLNQPRCSFRQLFGIFQKCRYHIVSWFGACPRRFLHSPIIITTFLLLCFLSVTLHLSFHIKYNKIPNSHYSSDQSLTMWPGSIAELHASKSFLSGLLASQHNDRSKNTTKDVRIQEGHKNICIGITSVRRRDGDYVDQLVGSLFRNGINSSHPLVHLFIYNANVDPSVHTTVNEMRKVIAVHTRAEMAVQDLVAMTGETLQATPAQKKGWLLKETTDYSDVLNYCRTKSDYTLILEDDVVTRPHALDEILLWIDEANQAYEKWLFIRMFYTEHFMGFSNVHIVEELKWGFACVFVVFSLAYFANILLRNAKKNSFGSRPNTAIISPTTTPVTNSTSGAETKTAQIIIFIVSVWIIGYLCIYLPLSIGRQNLFPLKRGLYEDMGTCCTQSILYNNKETEELEAFLRKSVTQSTKPVDILIDEYAATKNKERGLKPLVVSPSIFQHIGFKSSSLIATRRATMSYSFEKTIRKKYNL